MLHLREASFIFSLPDRWGKVPADAVASKLRIRAGRFPERIVLPLLDRQLRKRIGETLKILKPLQQVQDERTRLGQKSHYIPIPFLDFYLRLFTFFIKLLFSFHAEARYKSGEKYIEVIEASMRCLILARNFRTFVTTMSFRHFQGPAMNH